MDNYFITDAKKFNKRLKKNYKQLKIKNVYKFVTNLSFSCITLGFALN